METINSTRRVDRQQEIENEYLSVSDLCLGAGILVCTCLILYFCIMSWGNLHEILFLRSLNFIILFGGILFALNLYTKAINDKIDYFNGMLIGIKVTLIGVVPFALFIAFYLSYDNHLMEVIQQNVSIGKYLNPN